jgi:protein gp37
MYRDQERYGRDPKDVHRSAPATFNSPLKWKEPKRVFTCSWSDFFIEHADPWRDDAWWIIKNTPHLTYQILTKRPENIIGRLPGDWYLPNGYPNVWLGVSVENMDYLWRTSLLMAVPASVHFVSYEPALGPVDFNAANPGIDWIISGGESGNKPRPADPAWFRQVRDFCSENEIAYFHKQNGGSHKIDRAWGGRELDGRIHHAFPQVSA